MNDVMKNLVKRSFAAVTALSVLTVGIMLAGCSGSGGQSSQVVSGTAAVGEPLAGKVSLKDSSSPSIPKTIDISGDGSFAFDVTGMKAPFILQADGTAGGKTYRLHSFAEGTGTANINPLSDALVESSCEDEDSDAVYGNPDSAKLEKMKHKMDIAVGDLLEKIKPLLLKFNADGKHPIKDECKADHKGMDGVFDHVNITIIDGILTITNKATGAVIFTGSVKDIKNGHFTDNDDDLPVPTPTLTAPTNVVALGGSGEMTVSWNAVSTATSYNVYYATSAGVTTATGTKVAATAASYVLSGLAADTTYYFIVTAVNSSGEGVASVEASAVTSATQPVQVIPVAPAGLVATGGTNQVTLSWNSVANATSYNVYFATTSGVTKANGTKIASATTPAVLGSLLADTTYYYIVTAENSVGEGVASVQVSAATTTTVPVPTAPTAPVAVTATGGDSQMSIAWPAVSGATSYNIYWSTTTGVTTTGTKIVGATAPYVQTALTAATTYYYIVTAENSVGESAASAQASAATNAAPPPVSSCTACHAIPPAVGKHAAHSSVACGTCHGAGYSSTTANAATHMNGVKNVAGTIGWDATARNCTNSCHGARSW